MRIALDGSDLAAERFEGPSVYAGELLPRLTRALVARGHAVTTYLPGPLRGVAVAGEVRVIPGSPFWTQRVLARALRADRPDALFLPIQMLPLFRPRNLATIAVIHDLEFLRYPHTYTRKNRLLLRWFTKDAVRRATRLIAVSQYTKDAVVRVYGRPPADVAVVRHGVAALPGNESAAVRRRLGLPDRYLLFVGAFQPRKNIPGLLDAYERLCADWFAPSRETVRLPELVLVGGGGWKEERILARIRSSPLRDRIHVFRRIPAADLASLYAAADLFVLPSFSEGFGMPVLEAMARGTPVVTSNVSALPDIAGDAALLVDPKDPAAIARAMRRVLEDASLRDNLRALGIRHAARFSWEEAAARTADVISSARQATAAT